MMTVQTESVMEPWSEEELRAKVGQLCIVGFHGHQPSENIKALIRTHKVGAVILFLRNVSTANQLIKLTTSLQEIATAAGHEQELFIAIDQENGLVTRIKSPVAAQLPGSMALGATGDASNAFKIASATAETLKAFGINMNYAPIADINSEPKNPVIGVRSPSDDPEVVGRFVSAQVKGLSEGDILPCVKHFPGHGDTAVDSHFGLPVITKSKAELNACELVPFKRAIVEGVESVMTAHIAMPGIGDPDLDENHSSKKVPASLNPDAIKILREEMKFDGMIVSDCLEMDGVRATFGTEKGAVMALKAGTDCVMICHTMSAQVGAIEQVVQAVKSGELSQKAIDASVERVRRLKTKYTIQSPAVPLEKLRKTTLRDAESRNIRQAALAADVYSKSTTVVRSESGTIPINPVQTKLVFVSPGKTPVGGGAVESGEEKTRESYTPASYIDLIRVHSSDAIDIRFHDGLQLSAEEEKHIADSDIIIFATRNASLSSYQKDFGLSLGRKYGKKLIVVATCDPYDFLEEKSDIKNYITIYEPTIPAFKAAVDVIFGVTKAQGCLPVGTAAVKHAIRLLTTSDDDFEHLWQLWHTIFPTWPIERQRLAMLLRQSPDRNCIYIHEKGFCLSFLNDGPQGKIAVVGVLPEYRGRGFATAFITNAQMQLRKMAREAGEGELKSLEIGSNFPRFWPQVPIDLPQEVKDFFRHRGFHKSTAPGARDFYRDIRGAIAPPEVLERVSKMKLKFSPWSADLYEECIAKQQANKFSWVSGYKAMAAYNQYDQVMVAFDPETNAQIGWTLMCSQATAFGQMLAFLPLMPSKEKTGLIGAVGIDESMRGKGVGLALMVKAIENLKERGIEGVCIDSVVIRGFYERLGFEVFWDYEGYVW
ncbi:glycoside hydrolase family 3 protein [Stipitochalara longipes BDJ]|nr:glycoside hydrolase family 3 protein [Stipitochalara longipes BDJ]